MQTFIQAVSALRTELNLRQKEIDETQRRSGEAEKAARLAQQKLERVQAEAARIESASQKEKAQARWASYPHPPTP
jgi:hypothetical protein